MEVKAAAAELFGRGLGYKAAATRLGVPRGTAMKWLYTYRALGKEALAMEKRRQYSHEERLAAARERVDEGLGEQEVMRRHGIRSRSALQRWVRAYREGGAAALEPKPRGRPRSAPAAFATREEALEARVLELELEVALQKRLSALADEIERGWHRG